MKTYLTFEFTGESESRKTNIYWVKSQVDLLGEIRWYAPWRRYCFSPDLKHRTIFDANCLREIADFCENLTKEHKNK